MKQFCTSPLNNGKALSKSPDVASKQQRARLAIENQPLSALLDMDLQVKFEKYRRKQGDWQLPLFDLKLNNLGGGASKVSTKHGIKKRVVVINNI